MREDNRKVRGESRRVIGSGIRRNILYKKQINKFNRRIKQNRYIEAMVILNIQHCW